MQLDPLRHVKFFAAVKHGEQKYSNGLPYTHHLAAVEAVARRFWCDETCYAFKATQQEMLEACWLHDVVEDVKGMKVKDVEEMFGTKVAQLVWAVSNEPGPSRAARHAVTYQRSGRSAPKLCSSSCVIGSPMLKPAESWSTCTETSMRASGETSTHSTRTASLVAS